MAIHDRYPRRTPLELTFPDAQVAERTFRAIATEAEARGTELNDPTSLVMLMAAGEALQALKGPSDDPERIQEHGALLFHAYMTWKAGSPLYFLDVDASRHLVETKPDRPRVRDLTETAAYLQLPQHLFWARVDVTAAPESVDGFFWTQADEALFVLLAMGMRGDRPGLSVVPLPGVPIGDLPQWVVDPMRETGTDFESSIPGAELDRLYEIRSAGEALKLVGRALLLLEDSPCDTHAPVVLHEDETGPRPSRLPYHRITGCD